MLRLPQSNQYADSNEPSMKIYRFAKLSSTNSTIPHLQMNEVNEISAFILQYQRIEEMRHESLNNSDKFYNKNNIISCAQG